MKIETLRKRVQTRLATIKGSFVYNLSIGSELHLLVRAKNLDEVHELAEDYIRAALRPEVTAGHMRGIDNVRVTGKTQSTVNIEVDVITNNQGIVRIPIEVG